MSERERAVCVRQRHLELENRGEIVSSKVEAHADVDARRVVDIVLHHHAAVDGSSHASAALKDREISQTIGQVLDLFTDNLLQWPLQARPDPLIVDAVGSK